MSTLTPQEIHDAGKEEWLAKRRRCVTASDLAILFGEGYSGTSPSLLYAQKKGLAPDVVESEKMEWGILMEPLIAEMYHRKTGIPMRLTNAWDLTCHPKHERYAATLDGWDAEQTLCELKNTELYVAGDEPLFMGWLIQAQWQMFVTEQDHANIVICQRGCKLVVKPQERDDEFLRRAVDKVDQFLGYLDSDTPPPVEGPDDNAAMKYLYRPTEGKTIAITDDSIELALDERSQLLAQQKELKGRLAMIDAETKSYLQDAEVATLPDGGKLTWKEDKNGRRTLRHYKARS
jgi:predicted phage-related endonuclease